MVEADIEHADLVGARLIAIGASPGEQAYVEISQLVPYDNDMTIQLLAPVYLADPRSIAALGSTTYPLRPGYVFERPDGERTIVDFAPPRRLGRSRLDRALHGPGGSAAAAGAPCISKSNSKKNFWYTYLENFEMLYIQYNLVQSRTASGLTMARMAREIEASWSRNPGARVV